MGELEKMMATTAIDQDRRERKYIQQKRAEFGSATDREFVQRWLDQLWDEVDIYHIIENYWQQASCEDESIYRAAEQLAEYASLAVMYSDDINGAKDGVVGWYWAKVKALSDRLPLISEINGVLRQTRQNRTKAERVMLKYFKQSIIILIPSIANRLESLNPGTPPQVDGGESTERKRRAKKQASFASIIQYTDKPQLLQRLHYLIDESQGADVGAVLLRAKLDGYLKRCPTQGEFLSEFKLGDTSWQAVSNYFNENDNKCLGKAGGIVIF